MKISEVSKKYDIPVDTLRYYEKAGLLKTVKKNSSGIREYTEEDCNWVEFIKCMRGAGLPVEVLEKYITLFYIEGTAQERKEILITQRDILAEKITNMQSTLERLNFKIDKYEQVIIPNEAKLKKKTIVTNI